MIPTRQSELCAMITVALFHMRENHSEKYEKSTSNYLHRMLFYFGPQHTLIRSLSPHNQKDETKNKRNKNLLMARSDINPQKAKLQSDVTLHFIY